MPASLPGILRCCHGLPSPQGFEIGSGFSGSRMVGSEHNDEYYMAAGEIRTRTNRQARAGPDCSQLPACLLTRAHVHSETC